MWCLSDCGLGQRLVSAVHVVTNSLVLNPAGNLSGSRAAPERLRCHETVFLFFKIIPRATVGNTAVHIRSSLVVSGLQVCCRRPALITEQKEIRM